VEKQLKSGSGNWQTTSCLIQSKPYVFDYAIWMPGYENYKGSIVQISPVLPV